MFKAKQSLVPYDKPNLKRKDREGQMNTPQCQICHRDEDYMVLALRYEGVVTQSSKKL